MAATPVNEVWGVGRQISKQLNEGGISNVMELTRLDAAMVKRRWSVMLERKVQELQGTPCLDLDQVPAPKQQIALHAVVRVVAELVRKPCMIGGTQNRYATNLASQRSVVTYQVNKPNVAKQNLVSIPV